MEHLCKDVLTKISQTSFKEFSEVCIYFFCYLSFNGHSRLDEKEQELEILVESFDETCKRYKMRIR